MKPKNNIKLQELESKVNDLQIAISQLQINSFANKTKHIFLEGGRCFGKTNLYEEWSKQLNEHLKEKGLNNSQPFAHPIENKEPKIDYNVMFGETKTPIAPPLGFSHDFHKGMIEAEKELNKVCKEIEIDCKCNDENSIHNIFSFEFNNIQVRQKKCFDCGKITITHRY